MLRRIGLVLLMLTLAAGCLALSDRSHTEDWVDLSWSGNGFVDEYLVTPIPALGSRNSLACVVAKNAGGSGRLATRSWRVWLMELPAADSQRYARGGINKLDMKRPPVDGNVLSSREFATLVDPPWVVADDPHPAIYYRRQAGHYQFLTWCAEHPRSDWNPSPGWFSCVLGGPWHRLSDPGTLELYWR